MGLFSPVHALLGQFALFGSHHSLFYAASLPFTKKLQHCRMFAGVFTSLHRWRARMFSWDLAPVLQYIATVVSAKEWTLLSRMFALCHHLAACVPPCTFVNAASHQLS